MFEFLGALGVLTGDEEEYLNTCQCYSDELEDELYEREQEENEIRTHSKLIS